MAHVLLILYPLMRFPIIALLFTASLAADTGSQEFAARCAACHGGDGRGGERGPAIALRGRSDQDLRDLIRKGIPGGGMPGFEIPAAKLGPLLAFVRSVGDDAG